jgi:hypothetical protein
MSETQSFQPDASFSSLVLTLSSSAWVSLGKIADPISGEVKQDIRAAKFSIDILIMLRDKTRGNLDDDETKLIEAVIHDLQANYAESVFSAAPGSETESNGSAEDGGEESGEPEPQSEKNGKKQT